jgi:microcystin-dependent protein
MIFNSSANVKLGATLVSRVSGDTWEPVNQPAFFRASAFPQLYMIAEVDTQDGQWIQLCRPYGAPSQTNIPVEICMDYTSEQNLPIGNVGDVDMADLYNRALLILDRAPTNVPLHGPSHVGLGLDPVPLASTTDSGLLGRLSGRTTDYVGGDNICHQLAGVPSGSMLVYAGPNIPANWLLCDGSAVSRSTYANLFAAIGGYYGSGDGSFTFNLPDCRGRTLIGAGAGPGLTNRGLAEKAGEEVHVITPNELAYHSHGVTDNKHTHSNAYNVYGSIQAFQPGGQGVVQPSVAWNASISSEYTGIGITASGANWGHNNMQPYLAAYVIIRT